LSKNRNAPKSSKTVGHTSWHYATILIPLRAVGGYFVKYFETLRPILEEAGRIALTIRAEGLETITKADGTPVTNADHAVSAFVAQELLAAFPHTKVISEELDDVSGVDHPLTWAIDPIDGTKKYLAGKPQWSIMVSLFDTQPIASMVYFPEGPVWYWAERGKGAFCDNQGVISQLHIAAPHAPLRIVRAPGFLPAIGEKGSYGFMKHTRKLVWNKIDVYVRNTIGYYDLVPPMLFVTEAGGVCVDVQGKPFELTNSHAEQSSVIICHPSALAHTLALLQK